MFTGLGNVFSLTLFFVFPYISPVEMKIIFGFTFIDDFKTFSVPNTLVKNAFLGFASHDIFPVRPAR